MLNVELLDRVMEEIEKSWEKQKMVAAEMGVDRDLILREEMARAIGGDIWCQTTWATETSCGTAMCFAGWTTHLSGLACNNYDDQTVLWNGRSTHISDAARVLLGLSDVQAANLFGGGNTLDTIRLLVERYKSEATA